MLKKTGYILLSMLTVFKHLFKKPVTLEYPERKKNVGEKFRGKPFVEKCIKCGTCIKVCPSGAIKIENDKYVFDMEKCIFCGNCSFYCPIKSIIMTKDYELATTDKCSLKLVYEIKEGQNERND